jgi:hypothetical protein
VLYTVPGEASWVCSEELLPAHALAGFMRELVKLELPQVSEIMQRWGVYYRPRPIAAEGEVETEETPAEQTP